MKVTYISHSGFSVELPSATLLFDYYKGQMPDFPADKPIFVFSSHSHGDHFVPQVFDLAKKYPHVHYIFSHDIWMMLKKHTRAGVPEEYFESATYLRAHETRRFSINNAGSSSISSSASTSTDVYNDLKNENLLMVSTLRSTDMGVAFLIKCDGLKIYHAGDLHWWAWPEDTKQSINNMAANYQREIAHLRELLTQQSDISPITTETFSDLTDASSILSHLDLAFLPLDGRLEENYAMGMDHFLSHIPVRHVFPMHFWDHYQVITDYLNTYQKPKVRPVFSETGPFPIIYSIACEGDFWIL